MPTTDLQDLYDTAIDHFPYPDLTTTGCTQGDLEDPSDDSIEYSAEYTFTAGQLLGEPIEGGGWIEIRRDTPDEEPTISAFFGLSRAGDWQNGRILPETVAVQGTFDPDTKTWDLWIDQY